MSKARRSDINRSLGRLVRKDHREYFDKLATELDEASMKGDMQRCAKIVNRMTRKSQLVACMPTHKFDNVTNKVGDMYTDTTDQLDDWFTLMNQRFSSVDDIDYDYNMCKAEECDGKDTFFTDGDFERAIHSSKLNKACGIDGVPFEVFKYSDAMKLALLQILTRRAVNKINGTTDPSA